MATGRSEISLVAALARALGHRMRGDLSVILNDLSYLGILTTDEEIQRARDRCSSIVRVLDKLAPLASKTVHLEAVPLSHLLDGTPQSLRQCIDLVPPAAIIHADVVSLRSAIVSLEGVMSAREGSRFSVACTVREGTVRFEFNDGIAASLEEGGGVTDYTEKFLPEECVIDGVVADLIFRAHDAAVCLQGGTGGTLISVVLPCIDGVHESLGS